MNTYTVYDYTTNQLSKIKASSHQAAAELVFDRPELCRVFRSSLRIMDEHGIAYYYREETVDKPIQTQRETLEYILQKKKDQPIFLAKDNQEDIVKHFMKHNGSALSDIYWLDYLENEANIGINPEHVQDLWEFMKDSGFLNDVESLTHWHSESYNDALKDARHAPDSRHVSAITPVD